MKTPQTDKILLYMKTYGSITAMDAVREFGCMRLAARISDLRNSGVPIDDKYESNKNRFGDTVSYKRYFLVKE